MNIDDPHDFPFNVGDFRVWAPKLLASTFPFAKKPLVRKNDIVFYYITELTRFFEASILIVGGGGSSNILTLQDLEEYDYIFSMNHCYKFPLFNERKVDLISVGANVNLKDPLFREYIDKFEPVLGFEIHPKFFNQAEQEEIAKLPNKFCYHTSVYGKIGVGVRLVNLAAAIGVDKIAFIGFDGSNAILEGNHCFEPGKKELPSLCTKENAYEIHKKQYDYFWRLMKRIYPNVEIISLDGENTLHEELRF